MAHFAEIDSNNIVLRVIVADDTQTESSIQERYKGIWKKTSYNGNIRGQFAGIGFIYHPEEDVFSSPKEFDSWTLGSNGEWVPPVPKPTDETDHTFYEWNETDQTWNQINIPEA